MFSWANGRFRVTFLLTAPFTSMVVVPKKASEEGVAALVIGEGLGCVVVDGQRLRVEVHGVGRVAVLRVVSVRPEQEVIAPPACQAQGNRGLAVGEVHFVFAGDERGWRALRVNGIRKGGCGHPVADGFGLRAAGQLRGESHHALVAGLSSGNFFLGAGDAGQHRRQHGCME